MRVKFNTKENGKVTEIGVIYIVMAIYVKEENALRLFSANNLIVITIEDVSQSDADMFIGRLVMHDNEENCYDLTSHSATYSFPNM